MANKNNFFLFCLLFLFLILVSSSFFVIVVAQSEITEDSNQTQKIKEADDFKKLTRSEKELIVNDIYNKKLNLTVPPLRDTDSKPTSKEIITIVKPDKRLYGNDRVVIELNSTDNINPTTSTFNTRYISIKDYNLKKPVKVIMYVGTNDITYSIYRHPDSDASYQRVREEGTFMFNVVSKDGYIQYYSNNFSAQIAGLPDRVIPKNTYFEYDIDNYATGHNNNFNTITFVNPDTGNNVNMFGDTGGTHSNSYFDITLNAGNGFVQFQSKNKLMSSRSFLVCVGSVPATEDCDTYTVTIQDNAGPTQIQSLNSPVNLGSSGSITYDLNNVFTNYDCANVQYADNVLMQTVLLGNACKGDIFTYQSTGSIKVTLNALSNTITLTIESQNLVYDDFIQIEVENDFGSASTSIEIITSQDSGTPTPPASNLTSGLEAYYPLNETSGTIFDVTGNGHNAVNNNAVAGVSGKVGTAYNTSRNTLDGTERIINISTPINTINKSFSVNAWIKRGNTSEDGAIIGTMNDTGCGTNTCFSMNVATNGSINGIFFGSGSVESISAITNTSDYVMATFTYVNSTKNMSIYFNGVYQRSSIVNNLNGQINRIGKYGSISQQNTQFTGSIDEIGIWLRALNNSEIQTLFNNNTGLTYPFTQNATGNATAPTQIASISDLNLGVNSEGTRLLTNFYNDFNTSSITFVSGTNSSNVTLQDNQSYASVNYNVSLLAGYVVKVNSFSNMTNFRIYVNVCHGVGGCIGNTTTSSFLVNITTGAPTQVASILPIRIEFGENDSRNIGNFFVNYNYTNITFRSPVSLLNTTLSRNESFNSSSFNITFKSNDEILVYANNTATEFNITIAVCTSIGVNCIFDNLIVGIEETIAVEGENPILTNLVNAVIELFPDADDLSTTEKITYVLLSMVVLALILGYASANKETGIPKAMIYLILFLEALLFLFFVRISYIPVGILVIGVLVIVAIAYLFIKFGGNNN